MDSLIYLYAIGVPLVTIILLMTNRSSNKASSYHEMNGINPLDSTNIIDILPTDYFNDSVTELLEHHSPELKHAIKTFPNSGYVLKLSSTASGNWFIGENDRFNPYASRHMLKLQSMPILSASLNKAFNTKDYKGLGGRAFLAADGIYKKDSQYNYIKVLGVKKESQIQTNNVRYLRTLVPIIIGISILLLSNFAQAHRSGCHRWHSCPSDTGSYVCGDLGYCSQCPDNIYCLNGNVRTNSTVTANGNSDTSSISVTKTLEAKNIHSGRPKERPQERHYADSYCKMVGGHSEKTLSNGTRVDCLTETYAIEVEFANRYYEAVGQSLHYSRVANRLPKIALILESNDDQRFVERLQQDLKHHSLGRKIAIDIIKTGH